MEILRLNNGVSIPAIGFGTYKLPDDDSGAGCVTEAIECGYRLIDGAVAYGNEKAVGEGVRRSTIPREELFLTGKVPNSERGYEKTLASFERTLADLQTDYLDLYLIHWPASPTYLSNWKEVNSETWRALERLYIDGRVRAIGVSNFMPEHLSQIVGEGRIIPMVNQIEYNPGMQQAECVEACRKYNIAIEGWSPLGRTRILTNSLICKIADELGKTPAQVCLRWEVQNGVIPLPKSSNPSRMRQNIDIFNFCLSDSQMKEISDLATFGNSGLTADNIENPR